jgi:cobalamin 5'-phosphate synthase/cobalamin synthase
MEEIRKNLWFVPIAGLIVGGIIAVPLFIGYEMGFNAGLIGLVVYILVEGIKGVHGLGKFGDAIFAPVERSREAMKEATLSTGGVVLVTLYLLILFFTFLRAEFMDVIYGQYLAKYAMLYALVTSKPSWKGFGFYMMRYARTIDLIPGALVLIPFLILSPEEALISFIAVFILTFFIKKFSELVFGGISGGVLGTVNCVAFATVLILLAGIPPAISFPQS